MEDIFPRWYLTQIANNHGHFLQVLRAFFLNLFVNLIQNDYLIELVRNWTYLGGKHNKFSQSLLVRAAKLEQHNRQYMQPRFHAAR